MIIKINTQLPDPIYEQLRNQIVFGIAAKQLVPGEGLPSVRRLAADLGINLHTVNKAYALLNDEGYIVMDRRKGALVAQLIPNDTGFVTNLSRRLHLAAAEAKCRKVNEKEFITLCRDCYQNIEKGQDSRNEEGGKK